MSVPQISLIPMTLKMSLQDNYKRLRLFIASPGDVTAERERVRAVAEELCRHGNVADQLGVSLQVLDWREVAPKMGRPQQVILEELQVEQWDIFIGILWLRFGSATGGVDSQSGQAFDSGTEEEFSLAYHAWLKNNRPHILFYRCTRPPENLEQLDPDQYKRVKAFIAAFEANKQHPGLYQSFQTTDDFGQRLRIDLTKLLFKYNEEVLKKDLHVPVIASAATPRESPEALQRRYLISLQNYCNFLPLAVFAEERDPHSSSRLKLKDVYINLHTTEIVDKTGKPVALEKRETLKRRAASEKEEELRPLAALEAAAQHEALVILGDPGSGKTSFINDLMFALAEKHLRPQSDLPANWPHSALLPVRVLLRELAVSLEKKDAAACMSQPHQNRQHNLSRMVAEHIAEHLVDYEAADFAAGLADAIDQRRCLIVFDGLDEAPPGQRSLVRFAVEAFCANHNGNRFIITCRIRSYEGSACLQNFKTVTLALFDKEQIAAFVARWYEALAQIGQFTPDQAEAKKQDLQQAAQRLPESLVANPLLLTAVANVHANNVELPRHRVKLYKSASAILLRRWQEQRAGKISLFEEIGLQEDKEMYRALRELGYLAQKMKRGQQSADIPEGEAFSVLSRNFASLPEPLVAAGKFLGYVDQTAGLLIGRGGPSGNVYAFPHRTFQEYFAGCHLAKGSRNFKRELLKLLPEGDYWRLAGQLGVEELLYNDNNDGPAMDVVYHLCPEKEPDLGNTSAWRGISWAAFFSLEIGLTRIQQDELGGGGPAFLSRLQQRLVTILEKSLLPARERAEAGYALAKLGDPRPGVCDFVPQMWVSLPGGKFKMGDDQGEDNEKPVHEVELSPFKISKYPITNAQFETFMKAGGYAEQKWWSKQGWEYCQKENWEAPRWWDDDRFNLPNQPVVGVSWFEAEAFCAWLSEQRAKAEERGVKSERRIVRLPTEAEWEFAARGIEGRKYPWGNDEPTVERANYKDSQINHTTAVGSYPLGVTPEGIFDLAGNVWEWCLDSYGEKYYAECKKKGVVKNPRGPQKGNYRVLRGVAYYSDLNDLRGSLRNRYSSGDWVRNDGFRVVLSAES